MMWGFVVLAVFLVWVTYEVDKSRKVRGQSGIPVLGYIFDSVSFNFREEIDGENLGTAMDKNQGNDGKTENDEKPNVAGPTTGSPKKPRKKPHKPKHKKGHRKSKESRRSSKQNKNSKEDKHE